MSTRIPEAVYQWLQFIQFWWLPPVCVLCRGSGNTQQDLCLDCRDSLPRLVHPCPGCALPLPAGMPANSPCGSCLAMPPAWHSLHAALAYQPPVTDMIAGFKYHGHAVNGRVLTDLLGQHLGARTGHHMLPELLVPVPLHRQRLRQRGFNQSLMIARWLSRQLAIPVWADLVLRHKATSQQTGLSAAARRRNLRGAFRINPGAHLPQEARVAIIDDVVTTGSTVAAMARTLRRAGAGDIQVWALARTIL